MLLKHGLYHSQFLTEVGVTYPARDADRGIEGGDLDVAAGRDDQLHVQPAAGSPTAEQWQIEDPALPWRVHHQR